MEVAIMQPVHQSHMDPAYIGQAPNMFLSDAGAQQPQERSRHGQPRGQTHTDGQAIISPQQHEYARDMMHSPDLSHVSWDEYAASSWDVHPQMLEQHGDAIHGHRPLSMVGQVSYGTAGAHTNFQHPEAGLLPAQGTMASASPMEFALSTSASPAPEMLGQENFASSLTQAAMNAEAQRQNYTAQRSHQHSQHRHMKSSPSPSRSQASGEVFRRKSAPSKAGSAKAGKTASPKSTPTSAPNNARSAHSAIERKYRENINNKITELHKVLCSAGPPLFQDQEMDSGGYPYTRLPRKDEDECSETGSTSGQLVLPAKKADVLAGAISYVRRSEREKRALVERLNTVTAQLQHLEAMMQGGGSNMA